MGRAAERNQPRHINRDIPSKTHVSLIYILSIRTLGVHFPPRQWPVPFTRLWKCLLRVAMCIPVLLEISLWLSWPCSYNSCAFTMSHSVHCCNLLPRWADFGFHFILWTSLHFFTFCLPCFCLAMMMLKLKKINLFKCLAWCLGWLMGGGRCITWTNYFLHPLCLHKNGNVRSVSSSDIETTHAQWHQVSQKQQLTHLTPSESVKIFTLLTAEKYCSNKATVSLAGSLHMPQSHFKSHFVLSSSIS